MADVSCKIRVCAADGCKNRMSSYEKDPHNLCPSCTGWLCNLDRRCVICADWSAARMKQYVQLQEGKARKKVYKDKQRSVRTGVGSGSTMAKCSAHSLSPSFSSDDGKNVPSQSVFDQLDKDRQSEILNVNSPSVDVIAPPHPLGSSSDLQIVSLEQGSVVLPRCGESQSNEGNEFLKRRDVDPLCTDVEKPVSRHVTGLRGESSCSVGHPPQIPVMEQVELGSGLASMEQFCTPAKTRYEKKSGSVSSRGSFSSEINSALRAILRDHKDSSDREKMRIMKEFLNQTDPSLSSYSSFTDRDKSLSVRTERSESARDRVDDAYGTGRYYKSMESSHNISVSRADETRRLVSVEVHASHSGKRSFAEPVASSSPKRVVLPKDWAMMVASGGALVREGFQYCFVDNSGQAHYVFPPSERSGKGELSGRGTEDVPLSLAQGISSSQAVSSGVVGAGLQPQGSGGEPSVCVSQRKVYSFVSVNVSQGKGESSSGSGGGKASLPLGSGGISSLFSAGASSGAPNFPINSGVGSLFGDKAVKPSFQDVSVFGSLKASHVAVSPQALELPQAVVSPQAPKSPQAAVSPQAPKSP